MDKVSDLKWNELPLSLSGSVLGVMLAAADYYVDWKVAVCLAIAVVFLHLLSKSYDDPACPVLWKRLFLLMTIAFGAAMIYFSFGTLLLMEPIILLIFGYMIIRAVVNTFFVSRGKAILYVFLLFGLVSLFGSYYLCSHSFGSWLLILPALSIGLFCVAAKADEDRKIFITVLTVIGWAAMITYASLRMFDPWHFLFIMSLPLFIMKKWNVAVPAFAVLSGIGFLIFLI